MTGTPIAPNMPFPLGQQAGRDSVWGIVGTGAEAMQTTHFDHKIFYIDETNGYSGVDGTDPLAPLDSLQELIDRTTALAAGTGTREPVLESYDVVYVRGSITEDVVTGDYTQMPGYVSIIGVGNGRYSPAWEGDDASTPSLDLRCVGWRISGFRFYGKTSAACIELRHTDSGANDIAIRTIVDHCYFDGLTTGLRGIESHGCYDCWFVNDTFALFNNGANTAVGMEVTTTPLAIPYRNHIVNCMFYDSDNGAIFPMNGSYVYGSMFQKTGYAYTMAQVLNTSTVANPGDDNVVFNCYFTGDFSIAGGYRPGAADTWFGCYSDDLAEAEVDAATGIVIGRPV